MDLGIDGRIAVVTGADSGIGWHTARILLEEGARVVMTDLDETRLRDAADALRGNGRGVHAVTADMTDASSLAALVDRTHEWAGSADILVNAAGITGATGPFHEIDDAGWTGALEVDLLGPVRVTRAFLPDLRAGGWGRIVFIASEDALQPYPDELPYCAAKAGILALSKGLSKAYGSDGLLVNAVSPAFIDTPMTDAMMDARAARSGSSRQEAVQSFLRQERPHIQLDRRGDPEEVAAVIAFLCSERSSFVTGANYRVDAGSVAAI